MPYTSETGRIAGLKQYCRIAGRGRARFWRALGFPNLVLAREARWGKLRARKQLEEAQRFSPFADPRDMPRDR